jgi:molecular chaperone DnaK
MSRTTIDFGIDLGTTNSAVAVLNGVSPEIIKNNEKDADITPSAVYIDKKGITRLGEAAKSRVPDSGGDVYLEFKRRMGTDHVYKFKSSGQQRKPEDLSAEILKSLKGDVQQKTGEILESAVITVPAAFELHQCDATRKAAQLAGFKDSPLLQEPVAAALAYGFQTDGKKAYWLVYDFGGGTFDAAVIKAEEGSIHVVNHGGDNFLGGSDIDWAIIEELLIPRLLQDYDLEDFSRAHAGWDDKAGSPRKWFRPFALLKRAAEMAKIELSRLDKTTIETIKFPNGNGEEIEFDCELTQADVIRVAEPIIRRSVEITKRVLHEKNLPKEAVERVILVGGPTKAPYFREMLKASLGIALDISVDPLTVVAKGAAVFAGTQKPAAGPRVAPVQGEFTVDLKHKPVGVDSSPIVGGTVSGSAPQDFTGFTIELVDSKTQWRSGKVPLRADGVFMTNLHAEKGERHVYLLELCDSTGRKQKITPDRLTYTIGAVVDEQPLPISVGVALANNEYDRFFEKGHGLPLKATRDYRTVHAIRQGQTGELIKIPIVQGENELADRNRHIDDLHIDATNIRRDLPAGTEVEVTLRMDASQSITVTAYVPTLDEEFSKKLELRKKTADAAMFLKGDFEAEMARFRDAKAKAANTGAQTAHDLVEEVEDSPLLQEVNGLLPSIAADVDVAGKFEKRLLELKLKLDAAADALEWPALVAEAKDWIKHLTRVAEKQGTQQQIQRAREMSTQTEEAIKEQKADRLRKRIEQATRLYYEIVMAQPGWWVYQFQEIEKKRDAMVDETRAAQLLDQGRDCISRNNTTGLQTVVRQLWDLLPDDVVQAAKRGYQSGVIR